MVKYLSSTKIYIYISLFACLFNVITNDQEGNFYLIAFEKAFKFILNDTPNAKILAEKLKSEKSMTMTFKLLKYERNELRDAFCLNERKNSTLKSMTD